MMDAMRTMREALGVSPAAHWLQLLEDSDEYGPKRL